MEIYTVRAGDNLWAISRRFGVPINTIVETNGLTSPESLAIGMDLVIPVAQTTYIVRPGDTLWRIGQTFKVNYLEIARVNNLRPPYPLFVGQLLNIPTEQIRYTVVPGDTLWAISQNFNTSISEIITTNQLLPPYIIYSGQVLVIGKTKRTIETLGYYNPARLTDKGALIRTLGRYLTYLGIFDFPMTLDGNIIGTLDAEVIAAASSENVALMPVITNLRYGSFDRELAYTVLSNETLMNTFINNLLALTNRYNLRGVIIDIENMAPNDRSIFTNFIQKLYETLKRNNKLLILNVPAKWEEWADKDWVGFFDFNALGSYIDIAAIMTYEFGWREGPPRPTVPINFITMALDYALANNIPAEKILLGMTLYGYDWELPDTPENLARTVTLPDVWDLARRYGAPIVFDQQAQQPTLDYVNENNIQHKVWFENARGHYVKYQLLEQYKLRGAFYWIINLPFPSTWYMLDQLFNINKIL